MIKSVGNKLIPGWNAWQYLFVFLIGFMGDMVVHFLAYRKKSGKFGLGESLIPYYNSFKKWPPIGLNPQIKNVLYSGFFGGLACMIALLGSDILLTIIYTSKSKKHTDKDDDGHKLIT